MRGVTVDCCGPGGRGFGGRNARTAGAGGKRSLRFRTRLQVLNIHFLRHFAFIRCFLRQILRQNQVHGLSEIGNNFGALPHRRSAEAPEKKHQRDDAGMYDKRANSRAPVPARVRGLVPVQQQIRTGIGA